MAGSQGDPAGSAEVPWGEARLVGVHGPTSIEGPEPCGKQETAAESPFDSKTLGGGQLRRQDSNLRPDG